jgi:hypothetical protein
VSTTRVSVGCFADCHGATLEVHPVRIGGGEVKVLCRLPAGSSDFLERDVDRALSPFDCRVRGSKRGPATTGVTMKYMLIMRASDEAYAEFQDVDFGQVLDTMGRYNDEMISAGVLVAAEGLDDAAEGVVVDYSSQPPVVTDGPYGETKELFGGYWILDVASKQEAVEWAKRAPLGGPGMKCEIRRVASIDEFPQDNEWVQKERAWRVATGQL